MKTLRDLWNFILDLWDVCWGAESDMDDYWMEDDDYEYEEEGEYDEEV